MTNVNWRDSYVSIEYVIERLKDCLEQIDDNYVLHEFLKECEHNLTMDMQNGK